MLMKSCRDLLQAAMAWNSKSARQHTHMQACTHLHALYPSIMLRIYTATRLVVASYPVYMYLQDSMMSTECIINLP